MKKALLKKRYGIPAALLVALSVVLVLSGTVIAWYCVENMSTETTVQEPLSTRGETEFSDTMYPGETNTWNFEIENSADVAYSIKANLTYSAPDGVSITRFVVDYVSGGSSIETDDLTDDGSAKFDLPAGEIASCHMTISADKDATPGDVSVTLELSRGE